MKTLIVVLSTLTLLAAACGANDLSDSRGADTTIPDDPLGVGPYPVATLDITITHPEADDLTYTISCLGDTATVLGDVAVNEQQACAALADDGVRTRLVNGAPSDQICTEIYGGPDVAAIVGTHDGDAVNTTVDRSNGCGVDDWDRLLAGILPPALGIVEPSSS